MDALKKIRFINADLLKLIAAISMFIDHLGFIFFPEKEIYRIIGRLAMPLFAFMIAEGCRYTKNKTKHFCMIFALGVACQFVYYVFDPTDLYFGILITFSISILLIYALQYLKGCLFDNGNARKKILAALLFFGGVIATYFFCEKFTVDYGFWGCMMPVFAALFDFHQIPAPDKLKKFDLLPLRIFYFAIPLCLMVFTIKSPFSTTFALATLPLLLLYSGKKGKWNLKYFFYVFYPLHLGLLQGLQMLLEKFK